MVISAGSKNYTDHQLLIVGVKVIFGCKGLMFRQLVGFMSHTLL